MNTSDKGLQFIADEEGFVGHVYVDFAGVPTIGYGHALKAGETFTTLTKAEALELLRKDAATAEHWVNTCVTVPLSQNQFDALVSFTFNLGGGALKSSTLLKYLNLGNFDAAADEFPKWCKAAGKTSPVLLRRRKRERTVFVTEDEG